MAEKYLIISPRDFVDSIRPTIKQKRSRGFDVVVKHVEDFGTPPDPDTMRNYILGEKPEYLLLVGDHDRTPSYRINNYDSDNYLGMEDNDIIPRAKVGRFSSNDTTILGEISRAIAAYPADPSENWKRKVVLTGWCPRATRDQDADDAGWRCIEEIGNYFDLALEFQNGSTSPATTPEQRRVWETEHNTVDTLIDEINTGAAIIRYLGHGNWDHWTNIGNNENFRDTHVGRLNVGDRLPFVISAACVTGDIQRNSVAEAWQVQRKAVGVLAADVTSDTWWNERFAPRLFNQIVSKRQRRVSDIIIEAMKAVHTDFSRDGTSKKHSHIYRYLGDPDTILAVPEDNGINECREVVFPIIERRGQYYCSPQIIDLGKNVRRAWATISGIDGPGVLPLSSVVARAEPQGTKVKIDVNVTLPQSSPRTGIPTLPPTASKGKVFVTVFALL